MNYQANKNAEDASYKKAAKAQFKGKDPTKYINRAKQYMKAANMNKTMNMNYQKLDTRERNRMNRKVVAGQYVAQLLGGAIGQGIYQMNVDRQLRKRLM